MEKLNINEWAEEDRPREKLMRLGADALSNAELLAILIGSGSTKETAVELMKRVLNECDNNLNTLGKMSINKLCAFNGIGEAKAIYNYMHPRMQDLDTEEAWILLMNQNYKLLKEERLSHGGITETADDVRVIMREALLHHATIIALCHNHPSNNNSPSRVDDILTHRVKGACDLMRIYFLDHIIVCDGQYYSYREQGRL